MRIGYGFDAHRFSPSGGVLLGGVLVDSEHGVDATSDGDVAAHALADALLGAAALGDLGVHFPVDDPTMRGADSMALLETVVAMVGAAGFVPRSVDVTVVVQDIRVAPHRAAIRTALATTLGLPVDAVSVKATTTDGMGFTGASEGLAAMALAVIDAVSAG